MTKYSNRAVNIQSTVKYQCLVLQSLLLHRETPEVLHVCMEAKLTTHK